MPLYFWRVAYAAEFLPAVVAILTFWGEVGGEGHLDPMPWYAKFGLSAGLALTVVTARISVHENDEDDSSGDDGVASVVPGRGGMGLRAAFGIGRSPSEVNL